MPSRYRTLAVYSLLLFATASLWLANELVGVELPSVWVILFGIAASLFVWQFGLRAWDVAAGLVLAKEAGADFRVLNEGTDWLAGGPIDLVVAAPSLLDEALAVGLPLLTSND